MELQRARGLVAVRSGRGVDAGSVVEPLSGGRSPLNAGSLGVTDQESSFNARLPVALVEAAKTQPFFRCSVAPPRCL